MALLIAGLAVFFAAHLSSPVGWATPLRARLGAARFKGLYAAVSGVGLVLIVIGFRQSSYQPLYEPLEGARSLRMRACRSPSSCWRARICARTSSAWSVIQ